MEPSQAFLARKFERGKFRQRPHLVRIAGVRGEGLLFPFEKDNSPFGQGAVVKHPVALDPSIERRGESSGADRSGKRELRTFGYILIGRYFRQGIRLSGGTVSLHRYLIAAHLYRGDPGLRIIP